MLYSGEFLTSIIVFSEIPDFIKMSTLHTLERLFTDQRKCMLPIMLEALLFLKVNREMWDLTIVAIAMKNNAPRGMNENLDMYYDTY